MQTTPSPRALLSGPMAELFAEIDRYVGTLGSLLLPVEKCWQPSELLPNLASAEWVDELRAFRDQAAGLPDDVLVTLVANMITEEALPSYHAWLCKLDPGFDRSGVDQESGMALWIRGWVAEEKRHGDVLARYLYATGRVDMRAIEVTIQHLLKNGFDPLTENSLLQGFVYTSFQERATFVAHSGTARAARQHGDHNLAKICDYVAGDEVRHEKAYERTVAKMFELAPDDTMIAFAAMLKKTIIMPSRLMSDGLDDDIFALFSAITQRNGIYTVDDYAKIMDHLVRLWKVETLDLKTPEAKEAQDFVGKLPTRYKKLAERAKERMAKIPPRPISWIQGRAVGA